MAIDRRRSVLRRAPAVAILAVAVYYAVWAGEYSAMDLLDLADRQEAEAMRLADSRARVDSLRAAADLLETDPATLEAIARERFGMIREGEILYRFLDIGPDSTGSAP